MSKYIVVSNFADFLKQEIERRKKNGDKWTFSMMYEEIAEHTGMNVNTIQNLRKGSTPSLETSLLIAGYFEVEVSKLWEMKYNTEWVDERERCTVEDCSTLVIASGLCTYHFSKKQAEDRKKRDVSCPDCGSVIEIKDNGHGSCKCGTHVKRLR